MTPISNSDHSPPETSLAEPFEAVDPRVDDSLANRAYTSTTNELPAWQQQAEHLTPLFSKALKAAGEALYEMTAHERAALKLALADIAMITENVDRLSRDLQSVREMVASLTKSQFELTARTAEIEASVEKNVSAAFEQRIKPQFPFWPCGQQEHTTLAVSWSR